VGFGTFLGGLRNLGGGGIENPKRPLGTPLTARNLQLGLIEIISRKIDWREKEEGGEVERKSSENPLENR